MIVGYHRMVISIQPTPGMNNMIIFLLLFSTKFVHQMSHIVLNTDTVIFPIFHADCNLKKMVAICDCDWLLSQICSLDSNVNIVDFHFDNGYMPYLYQACFTTCKANKVLCVCQKNYHIKYLSLRAEDHAHIYSNADTWYCLKCLSEIFPFNQIDDDDMFVLC